MKVGHVSSTILGVMIKSQCNIYINKLRVTLNNIFCSSLNFSMGSTEEKFISRDTARHFSTLFGTRASCSISGTDLEKCINIQIDILHFKYPDISNEDTMGTISNKSCT